MKGAIQAWRAALRGGQARDLNTILQLALEARDLDEPEQLDWLRSLIGWLRGSRKDTFSPEARVNLLLQRLQQHADLGRAAGEVIATVLSRGSALRVYCEAGVPSSASFSGELGGRMSRSLFPPLLTEGSLAGELQRVFATPGDDVWLAALPPAPREALLAWLTDSIPAERRAALVREAAEAVWVLGNRGASIALMSDVAARAAQTGPLAQHPMLRLEDETRRFARRIAEGGPADIDALLALTVEAEHFYDVVRAHLEERGVSLDLVFQIERGRAYLQRIRLLARVIDTVKAPHAEPAGKSQAVWELLVELVHGELQDRRPGRVVAQSLHLMARKTVERAGETGEEGIARGTPALRTIFLAALGGGVFITLTTFIKYLEPAGLPPFFHSLYHGLNYGGSFTAMHFLHLKLATKMPAMTASALASRMSDDPSPEADKSLVETAAAIVTTQLAALLGNLLGVIPAVLAVEAGLSAITGVHMLGEEKALHVIQSNSPWGSLAVLFAMFTGVILWASGWIGSWVDNAFAFYNVRETLCSDGGLRARFGPARLAVGADWIARHIGGVTAALIMGFSLAFAPLAGELFGIPLEVRHVTLVSGGDSLAASAIGLGALDAAQWAALGAGIALIGLCNLSVSFVLAFWMALRARGIPASRGRALLWRASLAILRDPLQVFRQLS